MTTRSGAPRAGGPSGLAALVRDGGAGAAASSALSRLDTLRSEALDPAALRLDGRWLDDPLDAGLDAGLDTGLDAGGRSAAEVRRETRPLRRQPQPRSSTWRHGTRRHGTASTDEPVGVSWTAGSALAARGLAMLLWVALACGPLALAVAALRGPDESAPAAAPADPSPRSAEAGALGVAVVGAWLSATVAEPGALAELVPGASVEATLPTPHRDLTVAATTPPDSAGLVAVTVAGLVDETPVPVDGVAADGPGIDGASGTAWTLRYFQVAVATAGGVAAVALPAMVAPPAAAPRPDSPRFPIDRTSDVGLAAELFLSAYLTGSSELERFTAPGAGLGPLGGSPYVSVQVRELRTDRDAGAPPVTGDRLTVRVVVAAVSGRGTTHVLTYWLALAARDGRWEVAAIAPGPPVAGDDGVNP